MTSPDKTPPRRTLLRLEKPAGTQSRRGVLPIAPDQTREGSSGSRCSSSGCGAKGTGRELPPETWQKVKDHPCYSEDAHHHFARMHVAVAPACNIQCNYCNRKYDCANESRPGVTSETLTPEQAAQKVAAVAARVPQLSVVGIAGPGDACYDFAKTRQTFLKIRERVSDVKLCLSTNGLALPDYVDQIVDLDVEHVTVTVNMVDPTVGREIYPWIFYKGKRWEGLDASKILHERQMMGLEMLLSHKVLCKINSVMIPGVNDEHLEEVNRRVMSMGAFLHNIMPLISDPAHGTHYGLTGRRGPRPAELEALQDRLSGDAKLMRHCRQCRADAVGMLGEDRGHEFTVDRITGTEVPDLAARAEYREQVERERAEHAITRRAAEERIGALDAGDSRLVAVATEGGGRINQHFGHAVEFQIYRVSSGGVTMVGHRKIPAYCEGGWGEESSLDEIIAALDGVKAVLCAKVGDCPKDSLAAAGIEAIDAYAHEWIETGVAAWYEAQRVAEAVEGPTAHVA